MAEQTFRIFVVDDDPVAQMITVDQLNDPRFEVSVFDNGEQCLAALEEAPDLILMDVEMPERDGISTCRGIRETGNKHTQVIFISSRDDIETSLAAYDAGGNDFILKPFSTEELAQKVRVAERFLEQRREYAQEARDAQQTAFTVLSFMGEQGTVIHFLRTSFGCDTPRQLADGLFAALEQYGLQGIVEIRDVNGEQCFSSKGICTPLEMSILGHAKGMDRIFQFHDRMAINYPRITLLVPNLPMDDPDRIGRLRDHLAILAEVADARLSTLDSERKRLAQADGIIRAVSDLTHVLEEIESQQSANRLNTLEAANAYLLEMERAFVHLGLSEGQEAELIAMAKAVTERFSQLQSAGKSLGDKLQQVNGELQRMVSAGS